jgi:Asp-tRNA(Asn)/Glu-tRNA(Gln) amidotransferase A subunit family amidase
MTAFASYDVETCRARIESRNPVLNALLHVVKQPRGGEGPLAGVPYVLKDTWDTAGIPTTGGSWRHRARVPSVSGRIHRALEATGAVLLGKSNLSDLAFSLETDNHLGGPTRNPYELARTAGGSTGGGAAAVADGMAAFDWGSDFGGSIRGPAAFCGVVGMRLSASVWPVEEDHFPRLSPFFFEMCGMGPISRDVAGAREVIGALQSLRRVTKRTGGEKLSIWAPDAPHAGQWPSFLDDVKHLGDLAADLPTPSEVSALYIEHVAANFGELMSTGELPLSKGFPAVLLGLASGGLIDRRIHPNTGILLLGLLGMRFVHRNKSRTAQRMASLRARVRAIWDAGELIVAPTTTFLPPMHGRAAFATRLMSFSQLGNLVDATSMAVPYGVFPGTGLPRSLQIIGPPGSEDAVMAAGERLMLR